MGVRCARSGSEAGGVQSSCWAAKVHWGAVSCERHAGTPGVLKSKANANDGGCDIEI